MATQTRVPGAASSEVEFELERFELAASDRMEIAGRWFGLRGRRFVRPVLNVRTRTGRRRLIALLEHKPWAADDGRIWLAAFAWPEGTGEVESAELEVGPGLAVELPPPGGGLSGAPRVNALRPHAPSVPALPVHPREETEPRQPPRRGAIDAAQAERDEAIAARDDAERDRLQALGERDDALSRRDAALRDVERANEERDQARTERDRVQTELDRVTHERDVAHAERRRTLQEKEAVERERDQAAAEREAARGELSRALPERDQALRERDVEITRADQAESERDTAYAERKSAVAQRDRARRERDRAMRAVGVEPPDDAPGVLAPRAAGRIGHAGRMIDRPRGGGRRALRARAAGARAGGGLTRRGGAAQPPAEADRHREPRPDARAQAAAHARGQLGAAPAVAHPARAVRRRALGRADRRGDTAGGDRHRGRAAAPDRGLTARVGEPARAAALLAWYERERRPLPWRATRDPYALLVSEVMLQQTQAERVVPYYERFLARFPDPAALAAAPPRTVLAAWSGLGYNRRALALQAAARAVVAGGWPADLRALPGVGPYTAAAVAAFAWDAPLAAVDANVRRVIERWDGRRRPPRALAARAAALLASGAPPTGTRR